MPGRAEGPSEGQRSRRVGIALLLGGAAALAWASWLLADGSNAMASPAPSLAPLLARLGAFGLAAALLCSGGIAWAHPRAAASRQRP